MVYSVVVRILDDAGVGWTSVIRHKSRSVPGQTFRVRHQFKHGRGTAVGKGVARRRHYDGR